MAGDLTRRVQYLRDRGILGKRETPRDRGWSTSEAFRIAEEAGYTDKIQGLSKTGDFPTITQSDKQTTMAGDGLLLASPASPSQERITLSAVRGAETELSPAFAAKYESARLQEERRAEARQQEFKKLNAKRYVTGNTAEYALLTPEGTLYTEQGREINFIKPKKTAQSAQIEAIQRERAFSAVRESRQTKMPSVAGEAAKIAIDIPLSPARGIAKIYLRQQSKLRRDLGTSRKAVPLFDIGKIPFLAGPVKKIRESIRPQGNLIFDRDVQNLALTVTGVGAIKYAPKVANYVGMGYATYSGVRALSPTATTQQKGQAVVDVGLFSIGPTTKLYKYAKELYYSPTSTRFLSRINAGSSTLTQPQLEIVDTKQTKLSMISPPKKPEESIKASSGSSDLFDVSEVLLSRKKEKSSPENNFVILGLKSIKDQYKKFSFENKLKRNEVAREKETSPFNYQLKKTLSIPDQKTKQLTLDRAEPISDEQIEYEYLFRGLNSPFAKEYQTKNPRVQKIGEGSKFIKTDTGYKQKYKFFYNENKKYSPEYQRNFRGELINVNLFSRGSEQEIKIDLTKTLFFRKKPAGFFRARSELSGPEEYIGLNEKSAPKREMEFSSGGGTLVLEKQTSASKTMSSLLGRQKREVYLLDFEENYVLQTSKATKKLNNKKKITFSALSALGIQRQSQVSRQAQASIQRQSQVSRQAQASIQIQSQVPRQAQVSIQRQSQVSRQAQASIQRQSQVSRQAQASIQRQFNLQKTSFKKIRKEKFPDFSPKKFDNLVKKPKFSYNRNKRRTKYQSSLLAREFGIKASRKFKSSTLTGLEIRGL